jgi:hypothetical protein
MKTRRSSSSQTPFAGVLAVRMAPVVRHAPEPPLRFASHAPKATPSARRLAEPRRGPSAVRSEAAPAGQSAGGRRERRAPGGGVACSAPFAGRIARLRPIAHLTGRIVPPTSPAGSPAFLPQRSDRTQNHLRNLTIDAIDADLGRRCMWGMRCLTRSPRNGSADRLCRSRQLPPGRATSRQVGPSPARSHHLPPSGIGNAAAAAAPLPRCPPLKAADPPTPTAGGRFARRPRATARSRIRCSPPP